MKFETVAESFNFYRNMSPEDLQKRAQEIGAEIDSNANADVAALTVELKGLKEAMENAETRSAAKKTLSLLEGIDLRPQEGALDAETVLESRAYHDAFFKRLLGRELNDTEKRAFDLAAENRRDTFNTTSTSAAVLPTTTLNEILSKARTIGGLLGEARAFNIPTGIAVPIGTPATKAAWHTEAEAVSAEKVDVATVSFAGYEIMKVFSVSEKVRRMSIGAFESYLISELQACVLETLGDALINGTGTSQGKGLEKITWSENKVEFAEKLAYSDLVKAAGLLKRGYAAGAKIAMNNRTLYNSIYGMVDTTGRPVFISDPKSEAVGRILGFSVVIDDNIADDTIYLGDFSRYLGYNLPGGISIEASRESSFKSGMVDYRAIAVADCKPLIEEAFIKISKQASEAA